MSNLTFVIFTYNEERRIQFVIKNYQKFGKVLIADGGSTDNTHEIAQNNGCEIFIRPKTNDAFVENSTVMDALFKIIETPWIFLGYADELMNKVTLEKVSETISNGKFDAINIYRKNYFFGEYCYDTYKSANNRFFKIGAYDFTDNVIHGMGKPTISEKRICTLPDKYFIHHFIDGTLDSHLSKLSKYTDSELKSSPKLTSRPSVSYFLFVFLKNLIKNYFFEKGYKTGFAALTLTKLTIFYGLIKNIKMYEMENRITNDEIEKKYNVYRDKVLKEFI